MTKESLNSDELGEKGQSRFREICADAKLVCNGSERDRTGWDFIVEMPLEETNQLSPLDKRPAPISCHFQVKTIWRKNDRIKLRLSAAERLAKEKKPAFIYIFKVSDDLEYVDAYFIHMIGDPLATILKRLRQEHARGANKINHKYISFSTSKMGVTIPPTGAALKEAIINACGHDASEYLTKKEKLIDSIGFDEPRFHGEISLRHGDDEVLIDAFLGKGTLEVDDFKAFETRFGIPLPQTPDGPNRGRLSFSPNPTDKCRVLIRSGGDTPVRFDCSVFSTPQIFSNIGWKIQIRHVDFEIEVSSLKGKQTMGLKLNDVVLSERRSISEWINRTKTMLALSKGNCTIVIAPQTLPRKSLSIKEKVAPENEAIAERTLNLLSATKKIFDLAGNQDNKFTLTEIIESRASIFQLKAIIDGKTDGMTVNVKPFSDREEYFEKLQNAETLVVSFLNVGLISIGYSFVTSLTAEKDDEHEYKLHSAALQLIEVVEFKNILEEFESFVEEQKLKSKTAGLIVNRPTT